jgi:Leucine-rich repeat (LRR) protein
LFEDENLEAAVRAALSVGEDDDVTCDLASTLTSLEAADRDIESLEGIQHFVGLEELDLWGNLISDISQLAGLTSLNRLVLGANSLRDVRALAGLTGLTFLQLRENEIDDLGPLSRLTRLIDLDISHNEIGDISALREVTGLTTLRVYFNPLTDIGAMRGMTELTELHVHDLPDLSTLQPLVENTGLGRGDLVIVFGSNVCSEVRGLKDKGVTVSGCTMESLWHHRWATLLSIVLLVVGGALFRRRNERRWAAWRAEASQAEKVDGAI